MMVEMQDVELSQVQAQAWVLEVREQSFEFKGIEERDFNGRIDGFFERNPKALPKLRSGVGFVVQGVLGRIGGKLDLGDVKFGWTPAGGKFK